MAASKKGGNEGRPLLPALWRWRFEMALLLAVAGILVGSYRLAGTWLTAPSVVVLLLAVVYSRRWLLRRLASARVRRRWARALHDCDITGFKPCEVTDSPTGELLRVRVGRGHSVNELDGRRLALASALSGRRYEVRDVRVKPDRKDARYVDVTIVRCDPFDGTESLTWPNVDASELSLWDPLPLGTDEHGRDVSVMMVERNILLGGEPGAGKSVALSLFCATAAKDPHAKLWIMDGKRLELAAWKPLAAGWAGPDGVDALKLLSQVRNVMDERYRDLEAQAVRKIERSLDLPVHVLIVDELAFYTRLSNTKMRQDIVEALRLLVSMGRAAGIIVCAATQKPDHGTVPTELRDLFGFRLALRSTTPQASDTILGQGWASAGYNAATVSGKQRGVGFLLAEGELPMRLRTYYLPDDDIKSIAMSAELQGMTG